MHLEWQVQAALILKDLQDLKAKIQNHYSNLRRLYKYEFHIIQYQLNYIIYYIQTNINLKQNSCIVRFYFVKFKHQFKQIYLRMLF
ncbi:unnamed protein product [Paramecium octaurelia]|uniref:Uncharacterized protein n=1 Tax=Paramecium octaurelia TaxID=43137 RepID=A0A8S1YPW0_PAROT|nr:unnamed protein product [Paramecium octaurelia]